MLCGCVCVFAHSSQNTHLYEQLRPEFVRRYANPLCSDAFSGFDKKESDAMQHKADIVAATKLLKEELVPKFANELPKHVRQQHEFCSRDLITALHDHGINVRLIVAFSSTLMVRAAISTTHSIAHPAWPTACVWCFTRPR